MKISCIYQCIHREDGRILEGAREQLGAMQAHNLLQHETSVQTGSVAVASHALKYPCGFADSRAPQEDDTKAVGGIFV